MSVRVVSFEAQVKQSLSIRLAANLGTAAALLRAEIQDAIGTQGPPRSSPGQPPHRDTGELQASFTDELDADALVARVGSDSPYVVPLELGGRHVAARPHIVRTLIKQSDAIARIICR